MKPQKRYPFYINKGTALIETIAGPFQKYREAKEQLKKYDFKVWISQVKTPDCGNFAK